MLLDVASSECGEMNDDMHEGAMNPDMDTVYSAAEEMRRFADRLNSLAEELMVVYRKMDHHQYMIDLDDLENESYAH
jgi:hypothetical protein